MLQSQKFAVSARNRGQATLERERQQFRAAQEAQAAAGSLWAGIGIEAEKDV